MATNTIFLPDEVGMQECKAASTSVAHRTSRRRPTYKPPRPPLDVMLPSMVQIMGCCRLVVLQCNPTCLKNRCEPTGM